MALVKITLDEDDIKMMVKKFLISEECHLLTGNMKEELSKVNLRGEFNVMHCNHPSDDSEYHLVKLEVNI